MLATALALALASVEPAEPAVLAPALRAPLDAAVAAALPELVEFYRDLHQHPELSLQEHRSAARIAGRLRAAGFRVIEGVGGTGVAGVLENGPGPVILVRGDMDALPVTEATGLPYRSEVVATAEGGGSTGVMHACGHDVHQTVLVGTAELLAKLRPRWSGTIVAVAQPAEEIGRGARLMIEGGLFDQVPRPTHCLALHIAADLEAGKVSCVPGFALANVDSVDVTIFGRGGHGSRPQDAVDPVVAAAQVISALQTVVSRRVDPLDAAVITVGAIHAGTKHNIIPAEARLQLTVRSYSDATRKLLLDGIRDVTTHTCRAMGCPQDPSVAVRDEDFTPATFNDPELARAAAEVFADLLGPDSVEERKPVMGGEDFGRFPQHLGVPGLLFWLGSIDAERMQAASVPGALPLPTAHSAYYWPAPEPTIGTGVRAMSALALALLRAG